MQVSRRYCIFEDETDNLPISQMARDALFIARHNTHSETRRRGGGERGGFSVDADFQMGIMDLCVRLFQIVEE